MQKEIASFYLNRPLLPTHHTWDFCRKHFRVKLCDGRFVKLNKFHNRLKPKTHSIAAPTEVTEGEYPLKVEDVFYSKTRMKILKLLTQLGQLNVSEIARRVGANYKATKKHLIVLEEEEILQHRMYGRTQLYSFNRLSRKSQAVQELIEAWNH